MLDRLVVKYSNPFLRISDEARADIGALLAHARTLHEENLKLRAELFGATQTLLAMTKSMGTVSLPHALIEQLDRRDRLGVSDRESPHGLLKVFTFIGYKSKVH